MSPRALCFLSGLGDYSLAVHVVRSGITGRRSDSPSVDHAETDGVDAVLDHGEEETKSLKMRCWRLCRAINRAEQAESDKVIGEGSRKWPVDQSTESVPMCSKLGSRRSQAWPTPILYHRMTSPGLSSSTSCESGCHGLYPGSSKGNAANSGSSFGHI